MSNSLIIGMLGEALGVSIEGFGVSVGGAELNTAMTIAGLAPHLVEAGQVEIGVKFFGAIGTKDLGDKRILNDDANRIINLMKESHIDSSHLKIDEENNTGRYTRNQVIEGRAVYYDRAGSATALLTEDYFKPAMLDGLNYFHTTGITTALPHKDGSITTDLLVVKFLAEANKRGIHTSFDPNFRDKFHGEDPGSEQKKQLLVKLMSMADTVFLGHEDYNKLLKGIPGFREVKEEEFLATELSKIESNLGKLHETGNSFNFNDKQAVVLKCGSKGARLVSRSDGLDITSFAVEVKVVDIIGAGDAFNGGFLAGKICGLTPQQCLNQGNVMGALAVMSKLDYIPRIEKDDLRRYFVTHSK